MVTTYTKPIRRYIITHSAVDYDVEDYTRACTATLRENAVNTAQLSLPDRYADFYSNKIDSNDRLRIYWDYLGRGGATDPPTNLVFDGYIDDAQPTLDKEGMFLNVIARGVGRSLLMSSCGEEYGSESHHDDLDTLKEIITDATDGIVPNWVNLIPWSGDTTSGYGLGLSFGGTEYVAAIAGAIPYVYFPFEPAKKCLDDLMDILQAIKGAAAGPHYIVTPTNYLCVATVGNHEADPANLWPTWWNTDQTGSTLVQGVDFLTHNLTKRAAEANYVLYHAHFRKPTNEQYTEEGDASNNGADLWVKDAASWTLSDDSDAADHKVGATSVQFHIDDDAVVSGARCPGANQNWEIDNWGGQYNKPRLHFMAKIANQLTALTVRLYSGAAYWECDFFSTLTSGTWKQFSFPVGPYWDEEEDDQFPGWTTGGAPDWNDVDYIKFMGACQALNVGDFWIDGLYFDGWILRGVRQAAAYTTANPVRVKVITDDVAKDDSGVAATETGAIARLAYAEWLRAKSTPIQGQIVIAGQPDIMAGQLCHIHAGKTSGGTYRIDDDFRIQEHQLTFVNDGLISKLSLTDDVTNGRPMPPVDAYNLLLKTTNPDFQTRQISSIKAREIDITQAVMENTH